MSMQESFTPSKKLLNYAQAKIIYKMDFNRIIVALLFLMVLICYSVVICVKNHVEPVFHTSIASILTLLVSQLRLKSKKPWCIFMPEDVRTH